MADNNIHETNRNTKTARATQNPCSEAAPRRPRDSRNCPNGRGIPQFCSSMEGCVQKRWTTSTGKQAASVKAMQTIREAALKASKASLKRPQSKRLQNRLVDITAYRKVDTETFRYKLSYRTCLANSTKAGLELPKAREAGQRTRRTGHRILAKEGLASYKKKPVELAELPYWLMKVVLCCNQQFGVPGRQEDKRLFTIAGTEETGFRQFLLSALLPSVGGWACISPFRIATSGWMILRHLYRCFWNIFRKALSWFSTAGWFTVGQREDCVRGFPCVLILNGFRLMPRNLIRSSRSGITASTVSLPTTLLTMYLHLKKLYVSLSSIFAHKKLCFIRFSKKPDLKYDSFH
jgi:hypothetical protein